MQILNLFWILWSATNVWIWVYSSCNSKLQQVNLLHQWKEKKCRQKKRAIFDFFKTDDECVKGKPILFSLKIYLLFISRFLFEMYFADGRPWTCETTQEGTNRLSLALPLMETQDWTTNISFVNLKKQYIWKSRSKPTTSYID